MSDQRNDYMEEVMAKQQRVAVARAAGRAMPANHLKNVVNPPQAAPPVHQV